tara:strand:+ start:871 stop:1218 length:348 start_codon:yes stop_codon:yes gene_type:complete
MEHLYFFDKHCYWCSQITPVIDELISNKYKIQKLSLDEPDNSRVYDLLKQKYNIECGTPLLINKNTGIALCGAAPKEAIVDWAENKIEQPKANTLTNKLNTIENKLDYIINLLSE